MPSRKSGIKNLKKTHRRRMHNLDIKTELKKTIKRFVDSVSDKKDEEAKTNLSIVYKKLDKATKSNIIAKNTAARRKSKFSKLLNSLAS